MSKNDQIEAVGHQFSNALYVLGRVIPRHYRHLCVGHMPDQNDGEAVNVAMTVMKCYPNYWGSVVDEPVSTTTTQAATTTKATTTTSTTVRVGTGFLVYGTKTNFVPFARRSRFALRRLTVFNHF